MALELYYTSAPRGLKPGSTGFCTVGMTTGMPANMVQRLEALGGYRQLYGVGDPNASRNPPVWAHWRINIGGSFYGILSHVRFSGADHQGRFNKFAHHLVLSPEEQAPAGPAWVMRQPGVMESQWLGEPRVIQVPKRIPTGDSPPAVCQAWAALVPGGDPGWAGMLAQAFVLDASRPAYVVYEPGMDLLPLMAEAIALLPAKMRWQVTYNTYLDSLPAGLSCCWRCVPAGTPQAQAAAANGMAGAFVDLTKASLGRAPDNHYVALARDGSSGYADLDFDEDTYEQQSRPASVVAMAAPVMAHAAEQDGYGLAGAENELDSIASVAQRPMAAPRYRSRRGEPEAMLASRRRWLMAALAIVWPVAVLGGGGWVLWQRTQTTPPPVVAVASDQVTKLERERDAANKLADKHKKDAEGLRTELQTAKGEAKTAEDSIKSLREELERQKTQMASATGTKPPDTATSATPNTGTNTTTPQPPVPPKVPAQPSVGEKHGDVEVHPFVGLGPDLSTGKQFRKSLRKDLPEGATVELKLSGTVGEDYGVEATDKAVEIVSKVRSGLTSDPGKPKPIFRVAVENGELVWEWVGPATLIQRASAMKELLQYSTVRVRHDNAEIYRCQFIPLQPMNLTLGDGRASTPASWKSDIGKTPLKLSALLPDSSGWQRSEESTDEVLKLRKGGAGAVIALTRGPNPQLALTWEERSAPDEIKKLIDEIDGRSRKAAADQDKLLAQSEGFQKNLEQDRKTHAILLENTKKDFEQAGQQLAAAEAKMREFRQEKGIDAAERDFHQKDEKKPKEDPNNRKARDEALRKLEKLKTDNGRELGDLQRAISQAAEKKGAIDEKRRVSEATYKRWEDELNAIHPKRQEIAKELDVIKGQRKAKETQLAEAASFPEMTVQVETKTDAQVVFARATLKYKGGAQ